MRSGAVGMRGSRGQKGYGARRGVVAHRPPAAIPSRALSLHMIMNKVLAQYLGNVEEKHGMAEWPCGPPVPKIHLSGLMKVPALSASVWSQLRQ